MRASNLLHLFTNMLCRRICHSAIGVSRRFATSHTPESSVLQRYKEQLARKAKEAGVSSIDELKKTFKDDIEKKKKAMNEVDPLKELEAYERDAAEKVKKARSAKDDSKVRDAIDASIPKAPYKQLSSFVDVEKFRALPEKELRFIWKARFQKNDRAMTAVLTGPQFGSLFANAFKNPNFVLPLPKEGAGYEMHFVQWSFVGPKTTHCMLTSLEEYKLHKEYAKPHTTLMFHQELLENSESQMVLMNGQLETDVALAVDEAQLLVLNVQRFYGGMTDLDGAERKLALLRAFTQGSSDFSMEKLIEEASSLE